MTEVNGVSPFVVGVFGVHRFGKVTAVGRLFQRRKFEAGFGVFAGVLKVQAVKAACSIDGRTEDGSDDTFAAGVVNNTADDRIFDFRKAEISENGPFGNFPF